MLLPVLLGAAQPSAKLAMLVAGMKSASQGSGRMILQTRPVKSKSFYFRSGKSERNHYRYVKRLDLNALGFVGLDLRARKKSFTLFVKFVNFFKCFLLEKTLPLP
jgi:hypothetical protein